MTSIHRDFSVAPTAQREVSFSLEGQTFACLPDVPLEAMVEHWATFVPDPEDPTKASIPLTAAIDLIKTSLRDDEARESFSKLLGTLDMETGSAAIYAVREFLVSTYTGVGPTTEPAGSSPGPSASVPTSTDASGSEGPTPT